MEDAKTVLHHLVTSVPETVLGVERQMLIGDLVVRLTQEEKLLLKQFMDSFLLRMFENSASDIDMGGNGSQGKLWYRIHGNKKPDADMAPLTEDETNALIQSILAERQRQYLYENRNLDFSYSVLRD